MADGSGEHGVSQVRLVEHVQAPGVVVVGREVHLALVRGYDTGYIVPVIAAVVAKLRAIANVETTNLVLYGGRSQVHQRLDAAVVWIAEERGNVRIGGSAVEGRNAAVRS